MKNLGKCWILSVVIWEQCGAGSSCIPRILFRYNDHEVVKVDDMLLGFSVVIVDKRNATSNLDESPFNLWLQEHITEPRRFEAKMCLKYPQITNRFVKEPRCSLFSPNSRHPFQKRHCYYEFWWTWVIGWMMMEHMPGWLQMLWILIF